MNTINDFLKKNRYIFLLVGLGLFVSCDRSIEPQTQENDERQSHEQLLHENANQQRVCDRFSPQKNANEEELLDVRLKRLVVATNMNLYAARMEKIEIFERILKISDHQEAFRLYDLLLELTIAQEVTTIECDRRQNWYAMLWYNARSAFREAQRTQGNDFAYWDKIFRFFEKYINEIAAIEKLFGNPCITLKNVHQSIKRVDDKARYLFMIKGDLKTWVRVMRDFEFPKMSKNYTPEQKADIMRRFKEVEKYTVTPPHYPGGKG